MKVPESDAGCVAFFYTASPSNCFGNKQRGRVTEGKAEKGVRVELETGRHTPSIAFRHFPPNSARSGYATEGALFISAQLSTDAVSALRRFGY